MFVALALASHLLVAAPADEGVARGVELYQALDYRGAAATLRKALADETLERADRLLALQTLARTLAILGKPKRAERRFVELLTLDPEATVSWEESERVREAFEAAQKTIAERSAAASRRAERRQRGPRRWTDRTGGIEVVPLPTTTATAGETPPAAEDRRWWVIGVIAGCGALAAGMITFAAIKLSSDDEPNVTATWNLP